MLLDLYINNTSTFWKNEEKHRITKTTQFFLPGISPVTKTGLWDAWQGPGVQFLAEEKFSLFHSIHPICHLHVVQG